MKLLSIGGYSPSNNQLVVTIEPAVAFGIRLSSWSKLYRREIWLHLGPVQIYYRLALDKGIMEEIEHFEAIAEAIRCPRCMDSCEITPEGLYCASCDTLWTDESSL